MSREHRHQRAGIAGRSCRCWRQASGRHGISTLWIVLTLPVLLTLVLYAVEAGRIHLARQQLVTSLESAALAAANRCATGGSPSTLEARNSGIDFAAANLVLGNPPGLSANRDSGNAPSENASCDGDIVFGSLVEVTPRTELHTQYLGACSQRSGPNAVATVQTSTATWQTVRLCFRSYTSMVVVGTINYSDADPPMVVRIRNVGANSFEFFVQNVNNDAPMAGYDVYFLIVEAGVYTMANDGVTMEAFTYNSTVTDEDDSWVGENRGYVNAYANPVVVGQVMSYNDPDWSVFWSHRGDRRFAADTTGLWTGKHVGEDSDVTRANETVGYIVLEEGAGNIGGLTYYAGDTQRSVGGVGNSPPYTFAFPSDAGTFAVASQSGERGGNGAFALLYGPDPIDPGRIAVSLDEDQNADAERNHVQENVHYAVFAGPCAVHVQQQMEIDWYFSSLFGCVLSNPSVRGQATAYFDCADHCSKLICVDEVVCP